MAVFLKLSTGNASTPARVSLQQRSKWRGGEVTTLEQDSASTIRHYTNYTQKENKTGHDLLSSNTYDP